MLLVVFTRPRMDYPAN